MTENFLQFMRYGMVGVVNTLLTFVSFVLLRHIGVGLDLSNFLSFSLGMICSFTLNKLWAFRARGGSVVNEALFFSVVQSCAGEYSGWCFVVYFCYCRNWWLNWVEWRCTHRWDLSLIRW